MNASEIRRSLDAIKDDPEFGARCEGLVDDWIAAGFGVEAVDPILRFMETHPEIDYGMPGALVHFVERAYLRGYAQLLLDSLARRPTPHTVWMLNRVINGTEDAALRGRYERAMERAAVHPLADSDTVEEVRGFLSRDE